ncbi:hypothetical protein NUW58_g2614 [Xylaria curta]|uniref:Uncharacterized protein n=1 Tax=Xylaria curta TaxID=42375 RepID=A0ACC1PFM8_9PEZI|nr:hypothetical protein NUW58_g2614 [Xylaria curta]
MNHSFDGHGLSREQLEAKAEAAALADQLDGNPSQHRGAPPKPSRSDEACDWRGDPPDPELDDLAQACEENQQPSRTVDTCDWRGDEPEQPDDDLGRICPPDNQAQQSGGRDKPGDEDDFIRMPIPQAPKVAEIPEILEPVDDSKTQDQKHDSEPSSKALAQDAKKLEVTKKPKKKAHAVNIAGPSETPPKEQAAANESPGEGKTHSPWVDSLEHMPAAMMEKVNMGVKQTLEAASRVLTPSSHKESHSNEPSGTGSGEKGSGLAPVSAARPHSDLYVPRSAQPPTESPREENRRGDNRNREREKIKSEKKAQREARRKARQEKNKERKERRREIKERQRKERQWKKTAKRGGELPPQLLQGLRTTPGSKVPYHPKCSICTKSAASIISSKKRNPKCAICAKASEQESVGEYLKSLGFNLEDLPSVDDLLRGIRNQFAKDNETAESSRTGDQASGDEDLMQHIALHIRDFTTDGRERVLRGHKCNKKSQPGRSDRHGLDGNRDSPTATDGEQSISSSSRSLYPSAVPIPSEIDWWVQALSSGESRSSPYRPSSPPRVITPLQR